MGPTRTCMICRKKTNKKELNRIVSEKGIAVWDKVQNINTRGMYLCHDRNCVLKCEKLVLKNKVKLKIPVTQESFIQVIDQIRNELGESCWEK